MVGCDGLMPGVTADPRRVRFPEQWKLEGVGGPHDASCKSWGFGTISFLAITSVDGTEGVCALQGGGRAEVLATAEIDTIGETVAWAAERANSS